MDRSNAEWLDSVGLYNNLAADLCLLQSHISALLAGSLDADLALSRNSISMSDPMHIADPVLHVINLFPINICRRHIPSWVFPMDTADASSCLRDLFFRKWKNAWENCDEIFDGIGVNAFLREALSGRCKITRSWCSLELVVVTFIVFFDRFSCDHRIPVPMRRTVLRIFLRDIVRRISVFPAYDMIFQLGYSYLKITGAICSASNAAEWAGERSPLVSHSLLLQSGETIHSCVPRIEEILAYSLAIQEIDRFIIGNSAQVGYGPEGRVSNAFFTDPLEQK